MWKKASVVNPSHHLSKRRHPLLPLISSQVDEQTASQMSKKKGYRIPFENVPIRPKPLVMSSKKAPKQESRVVAAFLFLQRDVC